MRVAVTGTPGTGKTTATERLATELDVIHLNDAIKREGLDDGVDEDRDSVVADFEAIESWLDGRDDVLIESHLAHHFDADRVIVLRAHPETIEERLADRDESDASIAENAESEALDVILTEAVESHGTDSVYEIDTTDRSRASVAEEIEAVVDGEREPSAGTVSFVEWL
ncbi:MULTISPECIES: adenylate kinase family protein [Halomicrobium]|uniref:Putative adenylate kinase n=2 Tax=Halomicrobium mukohataei TaxID=57705 RepID=C7NY26_HALMD|nr:MULTISPECIES: adenylate kinase family protein [Halomicrobium]ACV48486.1 nucleotide kinase [Halomicrobium mukohataei DSM 12286]QCD66890.1 adenylate kinase [Halomicrobium mukohataei]QFR21700.1 AAA family ATPase [Halomicrobium sp. ZPS1]